MTVCIAALYGDGEGVVLASDQMVTAHIPMGYEFEREGNKIIRITESAEICALTAGSVLISNSVIDAVRGYQDVENVTSAKQMAELVRVAYKEIRLMHLERTVLEPRGLDLNKYYSNQQALFPVIVQHIDEQLSTFQMDVEVIVAGPSGDRCTLHSIRHPGEVFDHSGIGFVALGSGWPHATYSLIDAQYVPSLDEQTVTCMVKEAKKRSEVAPGVGSKTDIRVVGSGE